MQRIRKATKRRRGVLTAVIVVLTVGLVGTFATWGSNDVTSANQQEEVTVFDQIDYYKQYIEELEADTTAEMTFDRANSLATGYTNLYKLYQQAHSEAVTAGDTENQDTYLVAYKAYAAKAADSYKDVLDNAPETLNSLGKANIFSSCGTALFWAGDIEGANEMFAQALELAPEDIDIANTYASLLFDFSGLDATVDYLNSYIAGLPMGSENVALAESLIQQYQDLADFYAQNNAIVDETSNADANAEENTDENTDVNAE